MKNDFECMSLALDYIERNYQDQPTLSDIAAPLKISPYYLQRLFKQWTGLSPKKMIQYHTIGFAKKLLLEPGSLLDISMQAGLSNTSRLHDLFVTFEAVTPGEYRSNGENIQIEYGFAETRFGKVLIAISGRGICNLFFVSSNSSDQLIKELKQIWFKSSLARNDTRIQKISDDIFTTGARHHLFIKGTNFQIKVWEALLTVPAGTAVSYDYLAKLIGNSKASRAVGTAVGSNPISLLIPCHRVIRKSGIIGNYRWGSGIKKSLLLYEYDQSQLKDF